MSCYFSISVIVFYPQISLIPKLRAIIIQYQGSLNPYFITKKRTLESPIEEPRSVLLSVPRFIWSVVSIIKYTVVPIIVSILSQIQVCQNIGLFLLPRFILRYHRYLNYRIQKSLKKTVFGMTRLDWVEESTQLFWNFYMSYNCEICFRMMKISLKTFLETVSIKTCINIEIKIRSSKFSITVIVVTWTWSF